MNEFIYLFRKDVPRQKKLYQAYIKTSEVKGLSYVGFKSNNVALVEIKDYLTKLDDYDSLTEKQINNMVEYLKQYIFIETFPKVKKVFKQLNDLSDYLSNKYNSNEYLHSEASRDNCLLIINSINSIKAVLARKMGRNPLEVEKMISFETVAGQLLNPKDNKFDEEKLLFMLTNLNSLYGTDRNKKDFNTTFCKQVSKAVIEKDVEKMFYFKSLYQHIANIKAIPLDHDYLMRLFGIQKTFIEETALEVKIKSMPFHHKTRKRMVQDYVLSIDNDETRNIDDAFSIEKVNSGFIVGIHIADVCSLGYFEEDSLDINQKNNVKKKDASLARNKERNAVSLFVLLDNNGLIRDYKMINTTLVTNINLVYHDIPKILTMQEVDPRLKDNVINLISVYNLLENDRFPTNPTIQNLAYLIVSKLMVLCGALYSYEFSKKGIPAIYLVGDPDCNHYSIENLEFHTGFEGLNNYSRVTSPIIDRMSLINQFFIHNCVYRRMSEERKGTMVLKLRPVVDKLNRNSNNNNSCY